MMYSRTALTLFKRSRDSTTTPLLSILLEGSHGSGKTALATKFALESKFPFVKIISTENFVCYS
jgi:vesicle-fusing ATPase